MEDQRSAILRCLREAAAASSSTSQQGPLAPNSQANSRAKLNEDPFSRQQMRLLRLVEMGAGGQQQKNPETSHRRAVANNNKNANKIFNQCERDMSSTRTPSIGLNQSPNDPRDLMFGLPGLAKCDFKQQVIARNSDEQNNNNNNNLMKQQPHAQVNNKLHQQQANCQLRSPKKTATTLDSGVNMTSSNSKNSLNDSSSSSTESNSGSGSSSSGIFGLEGEPSVQAPAERSARTEPRPEEPFELRAFIGEQSDEPPRAASRASSGAQPGSPPPEPGDQCYSSLCQDEFSSFIAGSWAPPVPPPSSAQGPSLVGVREEDERPRSSRDLASESHHPRDAAQVNQKLADGKHELDSLDLYLKRVQCLMRLSRGERGVSMEDTFDGSSSERLQASDYEISYTPLRQNLEPGLKVIQEFELEDGTTRCYETRDSFASIMGRGQTTPELNWDFHLDATNSHHNHQVDCCRHPIDCGDDSEISSNKLKQLENCLRRQLSERLGLKLDSRDEQLELRAQLIQFSQQFLEYQMKLSQQFAHATDWHSNWLFASSPSISPRNSDRINRPSSQQNTSREERGEGDNEENNSSSDAGASIDLLRYSTILVGQAAPVRLTYLASEESERLHEPVERLYALTASDSFWINGKTTSANKSHHQIDACQMLLYDGQEDDSSIGLDSTSKKQRRGRAKRRRLDVVYETTTSAQNNATNMSRAQTRRLQFAAFGHLFEGLLPVGYTISSISSAASQLELEQLDAFREKILNKFGQIMQNSQRPLISANEWNHPDQLIEDHSYTHSLSPEDCVRFEINLSNVELSQPLPIIQFCAKMSGSLPIKVSWFRGSSNKNDASNNIHHHHHHHQSMDNEGENSESEELGDMKFEEISDIFKDQFKWGSRLKIRRIDSGPASDSQESNWPVGMRANYDYEYQTEQSSWFRFRRSQKEIMFEIRQANEEVDYDRVYKCVIENYCSRKECTFRLSRSKNLLPTDEKNADQCSRSKAMVRRQQTRAGQAILRTWSQRTLHRVPPTALTANSHANALPSDESSMDESCQDQASRTERIRANSNPAGTRDSSSAHDHQASNGSSPNGNTLSRKRAREPNNQSNEQPKLGKDFPYHPENLLKRLAESQKLAKFGTLGRFTGSSLTFTKSTGPSEIVAERSYELQLEDKLELQTGGGELDGQKEQNHRCKSSINHDPSGEQQLTTLKSIEGQQQNKPEGQPVGGVERVHQTESESSCAAKGSQALEERPPLASDFSGQVQKQASSNQEMMPPSSRAQLANSRPRVPAKPVLGAQQQQQMTPTPALIISKNHYDRDRGTCDEKENSIIISNNNYDHFDDQQRQASKLINAYHEQREEILSPSSSELQAREPGPQSKAPDTTTSTRSVTVEGRPATVAPRRTNVKSLISRFSMNG